MDGQRKASRRSSSALAYDPVARRTILFGGLLWFDDVPILSAQFAHDTWAWDGAAGIWQQLSPRDHPVGRYDHAMAYDAARGVIVMAGGEYVIQDAISAISSGPSDETWEWDGVNWVYQPHPTPLYSGCCATGGFAMVYESARQQLLVFENTGGMLTDPMVTWVWATGNGRSLNFVDTAANGLLQDGSSAFPFTTVRQAYGCTLGGATMSIHGGDYREGGLVLTKQMQIMANGGAVRIH
jgi:hypothetical protein